MKTVRDLKIMARQEFGWAPDTQEYIQFLEENLLHELNKKRLPIKSSFDRQMEADPYGIWKP